MTTAIVIHSFLQSVNFINQDNVQIHLVSGFLGSGKTTGIQTACKVLMSEGHKVGVITNDQGIRLVDTGYFESLSILTSQVTDGCFCCNYNALDAKIQSLIETHQPDAIFAESVGSCTDIVATVMKPLRQYRNNVQVTVSTFADALLLKMLYVDGKELFGEEVNYIYRKQLEEAGIVVVTKVDLITDNELSSVQAYLRAQYPEKVILYVNGTEADSIAGWLKTLQQQSEQESKSSSLQIDYDIYGAGEAMLAWLDEEVEVYSSHEAAMEDAIAIADAIYQKIQDNQLVIGHLKFLIDDTYKISYTVTPEMRNVAETKLSSSSQILVNARIQTSPEFLRELVGAAIRETEEARACKTIVQSLSYFQPDYPKPTHRISD